MSRFRIVFALLCGALLASTVSVGTAQAVTPGVVIDYFGRTAPPHGTVVVTSDGTESSPYGRTNDQGNVTVHTVPGDFVNLRYPFDQPQDLTAGGTSSVLLVDLAGSLYTGNTRPDVLMSLAVTATDASGSTATAAVSVTGAPVQIPLGVGGLTGAADLQRIQSLDFRFTPATTQGDNHYGVSISQIVTAPADTIAQHLSASYAPPQATVGGTAEFTVYGAGGPFSPLSVTVDATTTNNACTLSDPVAATNGAKTFTATFAHVGTCSFSINEPGWPGVLDAPTLQRVIQVVAIPQTVTFTSSSPTRVSIGDTYTPAATGGGSGSPVRFGIAPASAGVCSVSGGTVSFDHAGSCVITADQAGTDLYAAAPTVTQTVAVATTPQAISFTTTAPDAPQLGDTYVVGATGGRSGNPVTFSVGSGTTNAACDLAGSTVTFRHAGTCVIAADQAGTSDIAAAPTATQTATVAKTAQVVSFTTDPPNPGYVGASVEVSTRSDHPATPVVVTSASPEVCRADGNIISLLSSGTCTLHADQLGDGDYLAAPTAVVSFSVVRVPSTVALSISPASATYGQPQHAEATVSPTTGTPAGTVQFTVDGADLGSPVTVSDGGRATSPVLTTASGAVLGAGSHRVDATFTPSDPATYAGQAASASATVGQAATSLAVSSHGSTLAAAVTAAPPGAGTPTGTVSFAADGKSVGSAPLVDGVATWSPPAGTGKQVTAVYAGDDNFSGSSGSATRVVNPELSVRIIAVPGRTAYGWYRGVVAVTFSCTPHGSALTTPCPKTVLLAAQGAGQSVTRTIIAADGGTATATAAGINIDRTPPRVSITGLEKGGRYLAPGPKPVCQAVDNLSGIDRCTISKTSKSVKGGTQVTYTAVALDKAGNFCATQTTVLLTSYAVVGARLDHTTYRLPADRTYTLVVSSRTRPTLHTTGASGPTLGTTAVRLSGSERGAPRWAIAVHAGGPGLRPGHTSRLHLVSGHRVDIVQVRVA